MRISDWSSDVCSSDLVGHHPGGAFNGLERDIARKTVGDDHIGIAPPQLVAFGEAFEPHRQIGGPAQQRGCFLKLAGALQVFLADRSEEHTSELQSLMRTSYAVFCLKKKK